MMAGTPLLLISLVAVTTIPAAICSALSSSGTGAAVPLEHGAELKWQRVPQACGETGAAASALLAAGRLAEQTVAEASAPAAATLLADFIRASREQALTAGAKPVPEAILGQLKGYFPEPLLARVRYQVGWAGHPTWPAEAFRLLGTRAVTFEDVIVFRDAAIAADPVIWAHELMHVEQFERLGIRGFAEIYLRDRDGVEAEAWRGAAEYKMWALQEGKLLVKRERPQDMQP